MKGRIVGSYLSSVLSISLVLLLVGMASLLIFNSRSVTDYFKENLQVSVLLKPQVQDADAEACRAMVAELPFVRSATLVTREQGTAELKEMLGEDFLSVFAASPVPVSIDLNLHADYVSPDSLAIVRSRISESPLVDEVVCQSNLVEALNTNLARISLVLGIFVLLMLFISWVLINNTVRLNIHARRFTIHTMRLVGATRAFIRAPFLGRAVLQGLVSALLALAAIAGGLYLLRDSFPQLFEAFGVKPLLLTAAVVLACGIGICVISTFFVVGRLVSLKKDELYY